MKREIKWFVRYNSAGQLSRNLRTIVLKFLEQDGMEGAPYRQPLFADLQNLFRLLDMMEREVVDPQKMEKHEPISNALKTEFKWFVKHTSTKCLSQNLRTLLLEFLEQSGMEETHHRMALFVDLPNLFWLLGTMEREVNEVAD